MKFHVTPKGPAECHATKRACQYGEVYESESAAEAAYEKELTEADAQAPEVRKAAKVSSRHPNAKDPDVERSDDRIGHHINELFAESPEDQQMMRSLAGATKGPLQHSPFAKEDADWNFSSCSSVQKIELEDGTVGYFKSIEKNSSIWAYDSYGVTPAEGMANEINAHRLAKSMGPKYESLVPATTLREVDGHLGSFQQESPGELYSSSLVSFDTGSGHRAAVFDATFGSLDRHDENFMIHSTEGENRCVLIDNSFAMPREQNQYRNAADLQSEYESEWLDKDDYEALDGAEAEIKTWIDEGSVDRKRGQLALERIELMRKQDRIIGY